MKMNKTHKQLSLERKIRFAILENKEHFKGGSLPIISLVTPHLIFDDYHKISCSRKKIKKRL